MVANQQNIAVRVLVVIRVAVRRILIEYGARGGIHRYKG